MLLRQTHLKRRDLDPAHDIFVGRARFEHPVPDDRQGVEQGRPAKIEEIGTAQLEFERPLTHELKAERSCREPVPQLVGNSELRYRKRRNPDRSATFAISMRAAPSPTQVSLVSIENTLATEPAVLTESRTGNTCESRLPDSVTDTGRDERNVAVGLVGRVAPRSGSADRYASQPRLSRSREVRCTSCARLPSFPPAGGRS